MYILDSAKSDILLINGFVLLLSSNLLNQIINHPHRQASKHTTMLGLTTINVINEGTRKATLSIQCGTT